MSTENESPSTADLYSLASDLDDASVCVRRTTGILNLLADAVERDIEIYPYEQYYVDAIHACLDDAIDAQKAIDVISESLYKIHFANKKLKDDARPIDEIVRLLLRADDEQRRAVLSFIRTYAGHI